MNLVDQLLHRSGLSSDVGQAMVDLLQVSSVPSFTHSIADMLTAARLPLLDA